MAKGKLSTKKDVAPKLTLKERTFADQYLINGGNGRQAAIFAKYSERSAEVLANRLLNKPHIKSYIDKRTTKIFDKFEITQERVARTYAVLAWYDARKFYNDDGSLKCVTELDDDTALAFMGMEIEKGTKTVKIKMADRKASLDSLCKMKGWNAPDRLVVTDDIEVGYGKEE